MAPFKDPQPRLVCCFWSYRDTKISWGVVVDWRSQEKRIFRTPWLCVCSECSITWFIPSPTGQHWKGLYFVSRFQKCMEKYVEVVSTPCPGLSMKPVCPLARKSQWKCQYPANKMIHSITLQTLANKLFFVIYMFWTWLWRTHIVACVYCEFGYWTTNY